MSVLETPRIYFKGQVDWDPIVTNNKKELYNETASTTVYPPDVPDKVTAFRKEAIAAVTPDKDGWNSWNPHGTHRSTFFESAVSGVDRGHGTDQKDPFVGAPANFMGMLVDLETYRTFTSQLFFDAITFGIQGGCRIVARRRSRFTSRYINFARNTVGAKAGIASVVWQTCFAKAKGGLEIHSVDSPALQALENALADDDVLGLTVQWNAYRTIYFNTPDLAYDGEDHPLLTKVSEKLIKKLEGGGFQPNPARSTIVGVIGLWRKGEPVNEPGGRVLVPGPDDSPQAPTVGTAHARLTRDSITLDLSNSISETGLDLVKADFGKLTVVAIDPGKTKPVEIASFDNSQYDRHAYESTSGIVTLPVTKEAATTAASADLQLRNSSGQVLLVEAAYRAVPLVPNLYMNEGAKETATLQVYHHGAPAGPGIDVRICVMGAMPTLIKGSFVKLLSPDPLHTAPDGTVSFPVSGTDSGVTAGGTGYGITAYVPLPYAPLPGQEPPKPPKNIDPQLHTFVYVRNLPVDKDIAELAPTWENVYCRVLANWHAMAPCMDNWLNLGDEAQVRSFAKLLKDLTKEENFEHFRYMPVTRDLTQGARTLLYRFLDSPPAASPPMICESGVSPRILTATADEDPIDPADPSRRMR